uniref:(northern house mosquito) hypothetical protein n=1 Tax=Culex pipiens TaxID=7175 RepID=A0A8D8JLF0_CULPI
MFEVDGGSSFDMSKNSSKVGCEVVFLGGSIVFTLSRSLEVEGATCCCSSLDKSKNSSKAWPSSSSYSSSSMFKLGIASSLKVRLPLESSKLSGVKWIEQINIESSPDPLDFASLLTIK